jgi:hypothetical protein
MNRPPARTPVVFGTVGAVLLVGAVFAQDRGPAPGRAGDAAKGQGPTRTFAAPEKCGPCHANLQARPGGFGIPQGNLLVKYNEIFTWQSDDKHSRAYDALVGPRGEAMGRALGYDVKTADACLACHSTGFLKADPPDRDASGANASKAAGVTCGACHGPYNEWEIHGLLAAGNNARWRTLTPQQKTEMGMYDLRDPAARSRVCNSCHVGDPSTDERKVVTHDMYAAGHPPLPGIELATFQEAQAPHWHRPKEIPLLNNVAAKDIKGLLDSFKAKDLGELRRRFHAEGDYPATGTVLAGGVVAFKDSMRLLAAWAKEAKAEGDVQGGNWPDFARMECSVCHHDLVSPGYLGWRQAEARKVAGRPGRPQSRQWPLALARVALELNAKQSRGARPAPDAFQEAVARLHDAFEASPYGDPPRVEKAAEALEAMADELLAGLKQHPLDATALPRILAALAAAPEGDYPDYDSARQVAWAIQSVYDEWKPRKAGERPPAPLDAIAKLVKLDPDATRPQRKALVASKAGQPADAPLLQALARLNEGEYKESLAKAAEFNPAEFKQALSALAASLSEGRTLPPPLPNPSR